MRQIIDGEFKVLSETTEPLPPKPEPIGDLDALGGFLALVALAAGCRWAFAALTG